MSTTPAAVPNLVQSRPQGPSEEMGEIWQNYYFYLYRFFGTLSTGQTRRRIFTLDGLNYADWRKDVPFWNCVDIASHLGGRWNLQTPVLGLWKTEKLQRVLNAAARVVTGTRKFDSSLS